ncbi:ROK family transcriptional regulator [Roseicyclus mahoneyensis]|uniref:Putative NBD/HSP70 family sugar kinase n=1 Tax=Roseicyclus mahoneyensis TaxID=164332 RepID=A0A316GMG6_9RHOB|nr:ROK family transcriptional regulator [Roseicyclus mahoneyensis]PWK62357.1 putative NBD/HSP70 family sugar kinase [Roseicyclus mahoneyensis]
MASTLLTPGSNAERSRLYNRGLVLGHIRREGEAGRAEIARASGLSTQAVSNIISDLLAEGWVVEAGRRLGQRGLPAVTYAIRAEAGAALGVEIRPDAVLAAWIDMSGHVLHGERIALSRARPEDVLPVLERLLARGQGAGVAIDALIGAGVVMPGPVGRTGLSGLATELPGWAEIDARAALERTLGLPVTVENDANTAAMAERVMGAAQGIDDFACLYFGAGLGLGLVAGGAVFGGAFGNAGEIGHIPVPARGGVQRLEDLASRMALARRLADAGLRTETVEDLETLHAACPPAYADWLEEASAALGHAVQILENLLDPETIVLTGALPPVILADLVARTPLPALSVANRPDRRHPRLIAGRVGRRAATLGAAALVVNTALSPRLVAPS